MQEWEELLCCQNGKQEPRVDSVDEVRRWDCRERSCRIVRAWEQDQPAKDAKMRLSARNWSLWDGEETADGFKVRMDIRCVGR